MRRNGDTMKELPKTYDPSSFEDRLYKTWSERGYFKPSDDRNAPTYSIVMPPPNITGQLHMGHALDNTLQDVLVRYKRMKGFSTLWVPGTDHASIATEAKIVEAMRREGITKDDIGRDGFLERAWAWKRTYGGRIVEQLKKLGSSCDWSRERFTMDEGCSEAVREVFIRLYEKGYIYLQSLSSMIPPLVLDAKGNEQILDMASAPGSKTTQISAMMNNTGHIIANELDKIRCERLKFNLNNQGATNVEVINGYGEKLGEKYLETFDRVLLDTPCSGEGRFIAEIAGTYRNWSLKTVKELSKIQRKLIKSGYNALKPGGIMVYSTCTLNLEENEDILKWALENLNLKIMDIDLSKKEVIDKAMDKFNEYITEFSKIYQEVKRK